MFRPLIHVGLDEQLLGPARGELGGQRFARLAAPPGDRGIHQVNGT
jgi:hypothetical protein